MEEVSDHKLTYPGFTKGINIPFQKHFAIAEFGYAGSTTMLIISFILNRTTWMLDLILYFPVSH